MNEATIEWNGPYYHTTTDHKYFYVKYRTIFLSRKYCADNFGIKKWKYIEGKTTRFKILSFVEIGSVLFCIIYCYRSYWLLKVHNYFWEYPKNIYGVPMKKPGSEIVYALDRYIESTKLTSSTIQRSKDEAEKIIKEAENGK